MSAKGKPPAPAIPTASTPSVRRSEVPAGRKYPEYLEYLRPDFVFSCAYCTLGESEAGGVRFTIDHYEPQNSRSDLTNEYSNLMYCCNQCNVLKGKRSPSDAQRAKGYRFFRVDGDVYTDHFERQQKLVKEKTPVGYYSINALDLNREALQRLRDYRERLTKCDDFVLSGILGLRRFQLDQLPRHFRGKAAKTIADAQTFGGRLVASIDALLAANARSFLLDEDQEKAIRARERSANLKQTEALQPGGMKAAKVLKQTGGSRGKGH